MKSTKFEIEIMEPNESFALIDKYVLFQMHKSTVVAKAIALGFKDYKPDSLLFVETIENAKEYLIKYAERKIIYTQIKLNNYPNGGITSYEDLLGNSCQTQGYIDKEIALKVDNEYQTFVDFSGNVIELRYKVNLELFNLWLKDYIQWHNEKGITISKENQRLIDSALLRIKNEN